MLRYPLFRGSQSGKLTKDAVQKTGPQIGTPRKNHLDGLVTIMLGFEGTLLGHADIVGMILGQLS